MSAFLLTPLRPRSRFDFPPSMAVLEKDKPLLEEASDYRTF
jgi:hypothetical protein